MPKTATIKELLNPDEYADKSVVMRVTGKLTKLFKPKTGSNNNGDWSLQNGEIQDSTGSMSICFSNNEQLMTARNKVITIEAVQSKQHGWTGLKVEDREYPEGTWIRELKATSTANISFDGGSQQQQQTNQSGQKTSGYGKPKQQEQQTQQPANRQVNLHPKQILADLIALHYDVAGLVNEIYNPEGTKKGDETDVAPFIATVFIEAAKNGLGMDYVKRAAAPIKKAYPPAPKDPAKWKDCVIPWGKVEGKTIAEISDDELKVMFDYFDGKKDNSPLAECVYKAALDRGVIAPPEEQPPDDVTGDTDGSLTAAPDDIPF